MVLFFRICVGKISQDVEGVLFLVDEAFLLQLTPDRRRDCSTSS